MKKWITVIVLVIVAAGLIYVVESGLIKWQPLTIIVAAVMAPFRFIWSLFGSEKEIRDRHEKKRDEEHAFQLALEQKIQQREERVANLYKEVDYLEARMQVLRTEKEKISEELKTMTAEKKQQLGQELLGS
jgi:uncharacterized protein YlxW (UPF0749 family)